MKHEKHPSNYRSNILRCIREGWKGSASFHTIATENFWEKMRPEYLTTVKIASEIIDQNTTLGDPYCTRLETKTSIVFQNCFEPLSMQRASGFFKTIYRTIINSSTRKGRVDIAIFWKTAQSIRSEATKWIIEVKNFNPSNAEIKKDIIRTAELACATDPIGDSSFDMGFVTYAIDATKIDPNNAKGNLLKQTKSLIKTKYKIKTHVDIFIIDEYLPVDDEGMDTHEHHIFYGVTISIRKA